MPRKRETDTANGTLLDYDAFAAQLAAKQTELIRITGAFADLYSAVHRHLSRNEPWRDFDFDHEEMRRLLADTAPPAEPVKPYKDWEPTDDIPD